MNEDFIVDEIYIQPPKKIKSGPKGKRGERGVVDVLNKRFEKILVANPSWGAFSRNEGSGNRWGQKVKLSESAKQIYTGDLACPDHFRWVVESKNGYDETDLFTCFKGKCGELDKFLEQVSNDSKRANRKPLLVWKKTRMPLVAFIPKSMGKKLKFSTELKYKGWIAGLLEELLAQTTDTFWFEI